MPVSIDPKDQKIWEYFIGRKTPVTIKQVMKTMLVSEAHARRALDYFVLKNLAETYKQSGTRLYRVKQ